VNVGYSGLIGLRYEGCAPILEDCGLRHAEVWAGLRVIEDARVAAAVRQRDDEKRKRAGWGRR